MYTVVFISRLPFSTPLTQYIINEKQSQYIRINFK